MADLEGQDAINLWKQGRDVWNAWVDLNPEADVSFAHADFSKFGTVDFSHFRFPKGDVRFEYAQFGRGVVLFNGTVFGEGGTFFSHARFGDGNVSFAHARFGKGAVHFDYACFGKGETSFNRTCFCEGYVSFDDARFGEGFVDFTEAKFGKGVVNFHDAQFGEGSVAFAHTRFGDGDVSFENAKFGERGVSFDGARFGEGKVSFFNAEFGGGSILFNNAEFGDGDINLSSARFGGGDVTFVDVHFGKGTVRFDKALFLGQFQLRDCVDPMKLKSLSFYGCKFESVVVLGGDFACAVDLRGTILPAHIDLDQLGITSRDGFSDEEDAATYRRLKELAENNRHHEAALRFFALERQALRGSGEMTPPARALDWLYDKLSNYGQSIRRPAGWLLALTVLSFGVLFLLANGAPCDKVSLGTVAFTALADSVPFLPTSRAINIDQATQALDCGWPRLWRLLHQFVAFVLLFLIGVGLRNRFRL